MDTNKKRLNLVLPLAITNNFTDCASVINPNFPESHLLQLDSWLFIFYNEHCFYEKRWQVCVFTNSFSAYMRKTPKKTKEDEENMGLIKKN
jgi:hypothetical protein